MSAKSDLLKIKPMPVQITVPEWGEKDVYVVPLTGKETKELVDTEAEMDAGEVDAVAVVAGYVMRHMTDGEGDRIFEDDDLDELLSLPWDGTRSVYYAITNVNIRRVAMTKAAKGNSKKTPS